MAADPWDDALRFVAGRLSSAQRDRVGGWPASITLDVNGLGPTLFCHATPRSDTEIVTRITPEERMREALGGVRERIVVCGHTHMQFDREVGSHRVVNAGSVGMPYEGQTGAYWTLLGPAVEPRRTAYDVEAAAAAIRRTGYPGAEDFASRYVLASMAPGEVTETFERMATEKSSSA
jgi:diadenosine tetraphosphatase ApaH/serine/threonine PP2A family protein phosphatase